MPDRRTELRELLAPHAQALIRKAVDLAESGDTTALRLCLERLVPPIKATDEPVDFGQPSDSFSDHGRTIMEACLTGKITPSQASTLMQALAGQARVFETDQLAARLEVLEGKLEAPK